MPAVRDFIHGINTEKPRRHVTLHMIQEFLASELGVCVGRRQLSSALRAAGFVYGNPASSSAGFIEAESPAAVERRVQYITHMLALRGEDGLPLKPVISVDESFCAVRPPPMWTWYDHLGMERVASSQEGGPIVVLLGAGVVFSRYGQLHGEWVPGSVQVWNASTDAVVADTLAEGQAIDDVPEVGAADSDETSALPAAAAAASSSSSASSTSGPAAGRKRNSSSAAAGRRKRQHPIAEAVHDSATLPAHEDAGAADAGDAACEHSGHVTASLFQRWFRSMCASARDKYGSCCIVLDNAKVHTTKSVPDPTTQWRKPALVDFCSRNNIEVPPGATVKQLLALARAARVPSKYVVADIAREYGHELHFVPPYHPELNYIEFMWANAKKRIRLHPPRNMADLIVKARKALSECDTVQVWSKGYRRTVSWEEEYARRHNIKKSS